MTIFAGMGGITGSGDKLRAERANAEAVADDDATDLKRIMAERAAWRATAPTPQTD